MHPSLGGPHTQPEQEEASQPGEGTTHTAHPTEGVSGYVRGGAPTPNMGTKESLEADKKLN